MTNTFSISRRRTVVVLLFVSVLMLMAVLVWRTIVSTFWHTNYPIADIVFSPDGQLLAAVESLKPVSTTPPPSADEVVRVIHVRRVADGQVFQTLEGHAGAVVAIAFSPDGRVIASTSVDRTMKLWQVSNGKLLESRTTHDEVTNGVAFCATGRLLATSDRSGITLWNTSDWQVVHRIPTSAWKIAFNPGCDRVAARGAHATIDIWDIRTSQRVTSIPLSDDYFFDWGWSPDGSLLATSETVVKIWQVADGQVAATLRPPNGYQPARIAWHPNGQVLAVAINEARRPVHIDVLGNQVGQVQVWRIRDGQLVQKSTLHAQPLHALAVSPDGHIIASGGKGKVIRLWTLDALSIP